MPDIAPLGVIKTCVTIDNIAYCDMENIFVEITDGLYGSKIRIHFILFRDLLHLLYSQTHYSVNIIKLRYVIIKHSIPTSNS